MSSEDSDITKLSKDSESKESEINELNDTEKKMETPSENHSRQQKEPESKDGEKIPEVDSIENINEEKNVKLDNKLSHLATNYFYLLKGKDGKYVMVDCGDLKNWDKEIFPFIKDLDIAYCIITHAHHDHYGALHKLIELKKDCKIIAHEIGALAMKDGKQGQLIGSGFGMKIVLGIMKLFPTAKKQLKVQANYTLSKTAKLDDKVVVELKENWGVEVLVTEGHTNCSISVLRQTDDVCDIFVGDLIFRGKKKGGSGIGLHLLISNFEDFYESLVTVVEVKPKRIYANHVDGWFTCENVIDAFPKMKEYLKKEKKKENIEKKEEVLENEKKEEEIEEKK